MSQIYSRQTVPFQPPPQGPEEDDYIDYDEYEEYEDDYYYDDEEADNPLVKPLLIALSVGCLLFICMSCCVLVAGVGAIVMVPADGGVGDLFSSPLPGQDIGLSFEEPAFPDESVVNEEGMQLSIIEINRNVSLPDYTAVEGRELVVITVEMINLSNEDVGYSESEFLLINSFEEAYQVSPASASVNGALGRGTLAPGEGIEGRVTFDLVANEINLTLEWSGGRDAQPRYIYLE